MADLRLNQRPVLDTPNSLDDVIAIRPHQGVSDASVSDVVANRLAEDNLPNLISIRNLAQSIGGGGGVSLTEVDNQFNLDTLRDVEGVSYYRFAPAVLNQSTFGTYPPDTASGRRNFLLKEEISNRGEGSDGTQMREQTILIESDGNVIRFNRTNVADGAWNVWLRSGGIQEITSFESTFTGQLRINFLNENGIQQSVTSDVPPNQKAQIVQALGDPDLTTDSIDGIAVSSGGAASKSAKASLPSFGGTDDGGYVSWFTGRYTASALGTFPDDIQENALVFIQERGDWVSGVGLSAVILQNIIVVNSITDVREYRRQLSWTGASNPQTEWSEWAEIGAGSGSSQPAQGLPMVERGRGSVTLTFPRRFKDTGIPVPADTIFFTKTFVAAEPFPISRSDIITLNSAVDTAAVEGINSINIGPLTQGSSANAYISRSSTGTLLLAGDTNGTFELVVSAYQDGVLIQGERGLRGENGLPGEPGSPGEPGTNGVDRTSSSIAILYVDGRIIFLDDRGNPSRNVISRVGGNNLGITHDPINDRFLVIDTNSDTITPVTMGGIRLEPIQTAGLDGHLTGITFDTVNLRILALRNTNEAIIPISLDGTVGEPIATNIGDNGQGLAFDTLNNRILYADFAGDVIPVELDGTIGDPLFSSGRPFEGIAFDSVNNRLLTIEFGSTNVNVWQLDGNLRATYEVDMGGTNNGLAFIPPSPRTFKALADTPSEYTADDVGKAISINSDLTKFEFIDVASGGASSLRIFSKQEINVNPPTPTATSYNRDTGLLVGLNTQWSQTYPPTLNHQLDEVRWVSDVIVASNGTITFGTPYLHTVALVDGEGITTSRSGDNVTIRAEAAATNNAGIARIASNTEADAGSDNTVMMTPFQTQRKLDGLDLTGGGVVDPTPIDFLSADATSQANISSIGLDTRGFGGIGTGGDTASGGAKKFIHFQSNEQNDRIKFNGNLDNSFSHLQGGGYTVEVVADYDSPGTTFTENGHVELDIETEVNGVFKVEKYVGKDSFLKDSTEGQVAAEASFRYNTGHNVRIGIRSVGAIVTMTSARVKITPEYAAVGEGVAKGGTAGQVLAKKTATDFDTEWVNQSGGSGGSGASTSLTPNTISVSFNLDALRTEVGYKLYSYQQTTPRLPGTYPPGWGAAIVIEEHVLRHFSGSNLARRQIVSGCSGGNRATFIYERCQVDDTGGGAWGTWTVRNVGDLATHESRIDTLEASGGSGGQTLTAGSGINISGNQIQLQNAAVDNVGGVRLATDTESRETNLSSNTAVTPRGVGLAIDNRKAFRRIPITNNSQLFRGSNLATFSNVPIESTTTMSLGVQDNISVNASNNQITLQPGYYKVNIAWNLDGSIDGDNLGGARRIGFTRIINVSNNNVLDIDTAGYLRGGAAVLPSTNLMFVLSTATTLVIQQSSQQVASNDALNVLSTVNSHIDILKEG